MADESPENGQPVAPQAGSEEPSKNVPFGTPAVSSAAEVKDVSAGPAATTAESSLSPPSRTKAAGVSGRAATLGASREPALKPLPLDNELVRRMRGRFGAAIEEAWLDRRQSIIVVARDLLAEVARSCRDDEGFNMLTDLTAVDWPKREKRFDVVVNLYSFERNERLRLKAMVGEGESVPSLCPLWAAANWIEREVFDMFGINFDGHPDLRRMLLPEEWHGHPLRKDYDILRQDTAWVRENLGIESGQ